MDAPEKIYLDKNNKTLLDILSVKDTERIEYTCTNIIINKAVKYIANHFLAPGMNNEINDFVKYMKGK